MWDMRCRMIDWVSGLLSRIENPVYSIHPETRERGGDYARLVRVNKYSTPIAAWQTTQISSAVLKASGPREASG